MDSVVQLVSNCASRNIPAQQFLNFYHEFINEKYGTSLNSGDDEQDQESRKQILKTVADDLLEAFQINSDDLIIAEYMVHLLFMQYDTQLGSAFLPKVYGIKSQKLLTHFHTLAAAFIGKLEDKLIKEQMNADLSSFILPSCLQNDMKLFDNQLFISVVKYLQSLLGLISEPIDLMMDKERLKVNMSAISSRINKLNRILGKKINREIELKLQLSLGSKIKSLTSPQDLSPSLSSSRFGGTPGSAKPTDSSTSSSMKIHDVKLIRFYKNLWLNNKIHFFTTTDPQFLDKFSSINSKLSSSTTEEILIQDKVTDLIETTYISFAQLVNNKLYHQTNTNFTLLERKYVHFITKRLPLIIKDFAPQNPSVVVNSLQNMDEKVKKAIKSYYSSKNDSPERNEDLFDDYSGNNFDIRHDFLKNLIMLNLRPPSVLNEFLRDDQMVDTKTLKTDDSLVIINSQGVEETVTDINTTLQTLLEELEVENQYTANGSAYSFSPDAPILRLFQSFDSIAPTKQVEISDALLKMLEKAVESSDLKTLGKILWILTSNIGHATTTILCCLSAKPFMSIVVQFLQKGQTSSSNNSSEEPDFESLHSYVTFGLALSFVIFLKTTYNIDVEPFISNFEESYLLNFLSTLETIPETFTLHNDSENESKEYLQNWLRDLFINGSISDSQMKNTNVKDLMNLIPFIFKESIISVQSGAVSNIFTLTSGFEYFLQPFLMPGTIKIMFWLDHYLLALKNNNPPPQLLNACWEIINSLICPPSLDDDVKGLHFIILKLNCVRLLNALHLFRNDETNSNQYGVYATHESIDPKLESLITKLEYVASISNIYDIDPKFYETTKEGYSHSVIFSSKIPIINEFPIDKIMSNQLNSFWNLHSSTYYNYDYLLELIRLVTPEKFLLDSVRTLNYKVSAYGVPGSQAKLSTSAIDQVADFFAYFMILHDVTTEEQKKALLEYIETGEDPWTETETKQEIEPKIDDDFDMLFGEPFSNPMDDTSQLATQTDTTKHRGSLLFPMLNSTFGLIIADIKKIYDSSLANKTITKEEYDSATTFTRKYIENLKFSVV